MASVQRRQPRRSVVASASAGVNSWVESLEVRQLLAAVTVDTTKAVRTVDARLSGVNLAYWQGELNTSQMRSLVSAAGLKLFRLPGGSAADEFHFTSPPPYNGYNTVPVLANAVQAAGGDAVVTVDYGSGSPQEAAAMLAYLNAPTTSTVAIGVGQTWDTASAAWVNRDYQTAGYWASLRAAKPLASDDGLNFLRVNHPAAWGFTGYEIGNEEYATWETDHHSTNGTGKGGSSPATYIGFAKAFSVYAAQIDPNVKVGIDVSPALKYNMPDANWTADLLTQSAQQGFVPGFLSDHIYVTGLTDQNLLLHSVNDPAFKQDNNSSSWAARATYYRTLLNQKLGTAAAAGTQLMATEFNSDINTKQSANLVGGLWTADALGGLLGTEYTGAIHWDLTNGYNALTAADTSHYGWRQGVDEGLLSTGSGTGPASGKYVPYPTYFAEQLFSKLDLPGGTVLPVTSNDANLSVYAVKETDGHLRLMVINKSATAAVSVTFAFAGASLASTATLWQYGTAEDTAQSLTTDGHSALTTGTISGVGVGGLTQSFPAYSMSVIDLAPRPKVSVGDASVVEGDSGTKTIVFPVTLDKAAASAVTVQYATADGTATAGSDYVAASGTLTIAAGQTGGSILVTVNGDTRYEPDETFTLAITSTTADVARGAAVGTIVNDDAAPPAWLSPSADAAWTLSSNTLTVTAGTVTMLADPASTTAGMAVVVTGGKVVAAASAHLGTLSVAAGAAFSVAPGGGKLLRVTGLSVAPTATLDLSDNDLLYDYAGVSSPAAAVAALVGSARVGGTWTGFGLTSSAAKARGARNTTLGVMEASDYLTANGPAATFDGEVLDSTGVLVKYTLYGDADLDGGVSIADFNRLAGHFGLASGQTFATGDFDYDSGVSIADFNLLAANFGQTLAGAPAATPNVSTAELAVPRSVVPPTPRPAPTPKPATATASISGLAFDDRNHDGVYDKGDTVAAGQLVWLDLDNDGTKDANEASVRTDAKGRYAFVGLSAGTYRVRRAFARGVVESTPPRSLTLTTGQAFGGVNLGARAR